MNRSLNLTLTLLLAFPAASSAANLLLNPEFDTNLTGWNQPFGVPVVWSSTDHGSSPVSGSALVTNDDDPSSGGVAIALEQCVPVLPQRTYLFGGQIHLPAGQPDFSAGVFLVDTFTNASCSGAFVGTASVHQFESGAWLRSAGTVTTAAGVQSMLFSLGVGKDAGVSVPVQGYFDALFVLPDLVFADGFD